jgi:hypothetical protein
MMRALIPTTAIYTWLLDKENQLIGYLFCIDFGQPMLDPCREVRHAPKIKKITLIICTPATSTLEVRTSIFTHLDPLKNVLLLR